MENAISEKIFKLITPFVVSVKDAQHGLDHIHNVRNNAMAIADLVDPRQKQIDRNILDICVLTHDIAYCKHKLSFFFWVFEGYFSVKILKDLFKDRPMDDSAKEIILDSVKRHTHSFPIRFLNKKASLYAQILQDADTLDLFNEKRVAGFVNTHSVKLPKRFVTFLAKICQKHIGFFLNLDESRLYLFQKNYLDKLESANDFSYNDWNTGNEKTILCIHGYADDAEKFAPVANILKDKYRVVSLSLPMVTDRNYTFNIQELNAYVKKFCIVYKLKPDTVLGFSLGGLVALEFCYQNPTYSSELVLLNSLPILLPKNRIIQNLYPILRPVLKTKLFLYLLSRIRLPINSYHVLRGHKEKVLSDVSRTLIKKNYKSVYGTVINAIGYEGLSKYNQLDMDKKIVLFKDDSILKVDKYKNLIGDIDSGIAYFNEGGHAVKSSYWPQVSKVI